MNKIRHGKLKLFWAPILVLSFLLVACDGEKEIQPTPLAGFSPISSQPIAVTLIELARDPVAYEGDYLQLSGAYGRLPMLICGTDAHRSPATWGISGDTFKALASGYDTQLRALVAEGSMIAVAGRWRHWRGMVGCGRKAIEQEIWYLEVDEILSPPFLGQVAEVPPPGGGEAGAGQTEPIPSLLPSGDTGSPPDSQLTASPTPFAAGPPVTGTIAPPTHTPFTTLTPAPGSTTPQISATLVSEGGTGTPVTPPSSGTPTIDGAASATSPAGGSPTATGAASATPESGPTATLPSSPTETGTPIFTIAEQGALSTEELVGGTFAANTVHSWTFTVGASEKITVSVAGSSGIDIVLSLVNASGNTVTEQNLVPAGEVERITGLALASAGEYEIRVRSQNGAPGSYALMLLYEDSYSFVAKQIVSYGISLTAALAEESDHLWFFHGNSGESVTITILPNDNRDLFLELYGIDGTNLSGFVDDRAGGEQEELAGFVLPGTGVYSIRVGEYDFGASSYQFSLSGG
jgi:hypothetical protein